MKSIFTAILFIISFSVNAQSYWGESFDDSNDVYRSKFVIDTVNYHNNLWQIGKPQKTIFDSALSAPNAIMTDTLNPYPANDTSVFIVKQIHYYRGDILSFSFFYKLDIDSGTIAKLEISGDSGQHWINPITEDTAYQFYWGATKPRFDTSVPNWTQFNLNMNYWGQAYPGGPDTFASYLTSDTLLFRFTFISDSVTTPKDGWIMDNFMMEDTFGEDVKSLEETGIISIYPNPSKGDIYIHNTKQTGKASAIIYNTEGQEVYRLQSLSGNDYINLPLPDGLYLLKYTTGNKGSIHRIVIDR